MEAKKKKRLTLDLDPTFQRRLKAIAALKGVSMPAPWPTRTWRRLRRTLAGLGSSED